MNTIIPERNTNAATASADPQDIDALLRDDAEHGRLPMIEDAGFTARVMAALPTARSTQPTIVHAARLSLAKRVALMTAPTAITAIVLATTGRSSDFLIDATMDLATATITPNVIGLAMLLCVAVIAAVVSVVRVR